MARASFFSVKDIFQDRRKLTIFLICLLLSALSWILISLGKSYNTTLIVPLKYVNFPQNKTLLNEVPKQLAVNVSGSGYDLLQFDDRLTKDSLPINLDNLKMSALGDFQRGYLDQSIISNDLQRRLNGALAINRVLSDSINFLFDLKVARVLPIKPIVNFTVAKGFVQLDSVTSTPEEVEVYGALSIIDTMQYISTQTIDLGELAKSKSVKVALGKPGFMGTNQSVQDSVMVHVLIDQLTEKRFMIAPDQRNVPDSLDMLTFPNSVEVTVKVPLSKYDEINKDDFIIYVDYNDLKGGYMMLPVQLEKWTTNAQDIAIKPNKVEIVLSRKE